MSDHAQSFIAHLSGLAEMDRGALAHLRRSLGFEPGTYPRAYPYVERFVGADKHANDPWRKALYLTAGLFARHSEHRDGESLASALGRLAHDRESASIEQRFIALLGTGPEGLPNLLRQATSLLAADGYPYDYARLLDDLGVWLRPLDSEGRDRIRQRWARDFYRSYDAAPDNADNEQSDLTATQPID
jgi:CRISPR system Cascade subunit CasB